MQTIICRYMTIIDNDIYGISPCTRRFTCMVTHSFSKNGIQHTYESAIRCTLSERSNLTIYCATHARRPEIDCMTYHH